MERRWDVSAASTSKLLGTAAVRAIRNRSIMTIITSGISLIGLLQVTRRSYPQFLDANSQVFISPLVHIRIIGGKGALVDGEGVVGEHV